MAPPTPPTAERIPCEYGACYSVEDARAIALWANSIWRWAEDAHALCGPKED